MVQVLDKVAFNGQGVGTICHMGDEAWPGGRVRRLGVELNIIDPIVGIYSAMDGGVRVGEVNGGFVKIHLEFVVSIFWPIESKARLCILGSTCAWQAEKRSCGKVSNALWLDWSWSQLSNPTVMPWFVKRLLVHGIWGPRKWLVHPELAMARVLKAGRVAGMTELIEEKEFKAIFL